MVISPNFLRRNDSTKFLGGMALGEMTRIQSFDRIAGIEWNAVEFHGICCMARSVSSLPSPSSNIEAWPYGTSLRFAPAFRALGVCELI